MNRSNQTAQATPTTAQMALICALAGVGGTVLVSILSIAVLFVSGDARAAVSPEIARLAVKVISVLLLGAWAGLGAFTVWREQVAGRSWRLTVASLAVGAVTMAAVTWALAA